MPEPLTDDQKERLRELREKATPGPWGWRGHDDGLVELRGHGPFGRFDGRVVSTLKAEPCIVTLDDGDPALTINACDSCREKWAKDGCDGDLWEGYRCPKPQNLGTVYLWDERGFVRPANQWAVRERPYRSDVARVEHPDAELIVEAVNALPALLDENDRLRSLRDDIARAVRGDTFDVLRDFDRLPQEIKSQREDASDTADYVGVVYGLVHKLRGELPDGEDEHPGTWLENWVDGTLAENAELSQMVDDKLCGCGDVLAEGAKCPNCMTVDWVRYDAENERLRERIAHLTETVRDVAESLALGAASPASVALAARTLHTACQKAEEG